MKILTPFSFAFKTFNTVSNMYLAGQVGIWAYKQFRIMQKEKLRASELRQRFTEEYVKEYGEEPSEELIQSALRSYEAVEKPIQYRIKTFLETTHGRISSFSKF